MYFTPVVEYNPEVPRPGKPEEEKKIQAWAATHPKIVTMPDKPPLSDAAKLVRGLLASGAGAIFITSVYEYLTLAGVVDSMNAARLVLIFAGLVGFCGVLVSEIVWGKSRKTIVFTAIGTAIVLIIGLWSLDSWTVRYRIAHSPPAPVAPAPISAEELTKLIERWNQEQEKKNCQTWINAQGSKGMRFNNSRLEGTLGACGTAIDGRNSQDLQLNNTPVRVNPPK
jgi:hypothetical protein